MSTFRFCFEAIGTSWEIDTPETLHAGIRQEILGLVSRFDRTYSRFRKDSIIARISEAADGGSYTFPSGAEYMFHLYDRLYAATDGAVDPLVGQDKGKRTPALRHAKRDGALLRDLTRKPHDRFSSALGMPPDYLLIARKR